jgi:Tfp pilus assembly protein PilN
MTTLQKTIIGALLLTSVGTGIYQARQISQLREQNQLLEQQRAPMAGQIEQLQQERNDATNQLAALREAREESGLPRSMSVQSGAPKRITSSESMTCSQSITRTAGSV